ncbi:hypothetical protein BO78DRAFT_94665 [Aspergillus sclerotiicarbonarius CBS 121057]|uniref:Uncharacterized protein n=1 Tax=Aspergillus sclerotiicarbonarius (strain CBS 121057 / IBT 28362) TaxID=1448318 RepID=A0A319ETK3_ASPSB|nr:hypothetical protein BO78DRAFT_94665 [Aspergillus sclerotiicarbonarius CBS 121057]
MVIKKPSRSQGKQRHLSVSQFHKIFRCISPSLSQSPFSLIWFACPFRGLPFWVPLRRSQVQGEKKKEKRKKGKRKKRSPQPGATGKLVQEQTNRGSEARWGTSAEGPRDDIKAKRKGKQRRNRNNKQNNSRVIYIPVKLFLLLEETPLSVATRPICREKSKPPRYRLQKRFSSTHRDNCTSSQQL